MFAVDPRWNNHFSSKVPFLHNYTGSIKGGEGGSDRGGILGKVVLLNLVPHADSTYVGPWSKAMEPESLV